jgi:hypothetical protein
LVALDSRMLGAMAHRSAPPGEQRLIVMLD